MSEANETLVAEATYLARKSSRDKYQPLHVRIYQPVMAPANGDFKGMWICRCSFSGFVEFSEAFPGIDSLQALEYAQIIAAGYFAHLCDTADVRRPSASGRAPQEIPLLAKSFLATLVQDGKVKLTS